MARQLHRARQRIELRNIRSAAERILHFLELEADRQGRVMVEGALQDFAAELGLTREAFYRALAALERKRRIRRDAGSIMIKNTR
ncbi:helix-turn-helix domain-containing protein [Dongia sp.]|uniref:helix-turn-helix domain-containing protein n=1 Tax=Dongia sp. TaxID=1977262 RepID=UPI003751EE68